jgi:hypothetical protein
MRYAELAFSSHRMLRIEDRARLRQEAWGSLLTGDLPAGRSGRVTSPATAGGHGGYSGRPAVCQHRQPRIGRVLRPAVRR